MEETGKRKETIILTVLFAGYLVFNGILLAGHELWRDEANVWLISGTLSPVQLFREIRYQGHPCLWYLLVMPFAKIGLPFKTISVLSYLVMAAAAGVFTYRAPFHPMTKLICLAGPAFSYYYSVVARNYCLLALLLLLLACLYPERGRKPWLYGLLLGLLVQADTIALATAGLLSLMWLWESLSRSLREKNKGAFMTALKGLWIPLASLLLWILQFFHVADSPAYAPRKLSVTETVRETGNFVYSILSRMTGQGQTFDRIFLLLLLAAGIWISIKIKNFWPMAVAAGSFLFEALFSAVVYQLHIWHHIMLVFVLIWFFWVGFEKKSRIAAEALLILLSVTMLLQWTSKEESSNLGNALDGSYSDGIHTAAYIRQNLNKGEEIFAVNVSESSTVLAYLGGDYPFYYAGNGERITYADYTEKQKQTTSFQEFTDSVRKQFPEKDSVYLLESRTSCIEDISEEQRKGFVICYRTEEETAMGEEYTLYRITL